MVKVSETIICQRFIQNAWKKDLCSNCFKSKEDHVINTEISYRWTSHVNNFPQHGILKVRQKNGILKTRNVSFHSEETEIIGFGGDEFSSDDEFYPTLCEDTVPLEIDTDEDKEFRKLTQSNTDFNSVPANLKCDQQNADIRNAHSNLKLGKPLTGADGRRQTLQVSVEPFRNSLTVNGTVEKVKACSNKVIGEANEKTDKNLNISNHTSNGECINGIIINNDKLTNSDNDSNSENNNCDTKKNLIDNIQAGKDEYSLSKSSDFLAMTEKENSTDSGKVEIVEAKNESNVFIATSAENAIEIKNVNAKYSPISNVCVNTNVSKESNKNDVAENMKNAKSMLEPLFRLNGKREDKPKLSIYQSVGLNEKRCSINKDCNSIDLPLITSKELEIEFDKPGSREMVGEPDGKADSDDSYDALLAAEKSDEVKITDPLLSVNPQRSFLHAFKSKPSASLESTPKKSPSKDVVDDKQDFALSTPKAQGPMLSCNNTGSTKRQAPKPPSPKSAPPTPLMSTPTLDSAKMSNGTTGGQRVIEIDNNKLESPLMNGTRDAVCFLGEHGPSGVKRRLHLESASQKNRNSVACISMTPNGIDGQKKDAIVNGANEKNSDDRDTISIISSENIYQSTNFIKCNRSLSCDSISPPTGLQSTLTLSEKSRKYAGATIRMKSTLKKFLRFNSKEDEKSESESPVPVVPRRRIEIIHPLDLNKSSIEILRPQGISNQSENAKKGSCTQMNENGIKKFETNETDSAFSSTSENIYSNCSTVRPNKPPPPPRSQSLDHKLVSEISKPVRPPPPKAALLKSQPSSKPMPCKSSSNVYENLGESRQNIAPAKPQRASSMRDRNRQTSLAKNEEKTSPSQGWESEAIPECDRLPLQHHERQSSDTSDKPSASSTTYCGSETESDLCYQSAASSVITTSSNEIPEMVILESDERKNRTIVNNNLEDNYNAVVIANHEALSSLLDRVHQATLIPNTLKMLQTTLHIRFSHFNVEESSKVSVSDWHFYNAKWSGQDVVISVSSKHLGPMKSLPSCITLFPLIKFTDIVPSRFVQEEKVEKDTNAYITVWNEERIESFSSFCKECEKTKRFSENGLLLMQLMNALKHLQACGIEDISMDEMLICKRETDVESKLVLSPMTVDCVTTKTQNDDKKRMSLCTCASNVLNILLPKQQITNIVRKILSDERAASLSQAKAVSEYWLWGPFNMTLTIDKQVALQRWLDLERATYLQKMVCKNLEELSLHERCHVMFLVRTNAKLLTEASYLLEKCTM